LRVTAYSSLRVTAYSSLRVTAYSSLRVTACRVPCCRVGRIDSSRGCAPYLFHTRRRCACAAHSCACSPAFCRGPCCRAGRIDSSRGCAPYLFHTRRTFCAAWEEVCVERLSHEKKSDVRKKKRGRKMPKGITRCPAKSVTVEIVGRPAPAVARIVARRRRAGVAAAFRLSSRRVVESRRDCKVTRSRARRKCHRGPTLVPCYEKSTNWARVPRT
jgi:hypothetical protein